MNARRTANWVGDVRCGLHSGFPRCCIKFFIGGWRRMLPDERSRRFEHTPEVGYVRCPECVASGNFVKVKPCPVGSHGGNVIERAENHYEWVDGRIVLVKVEYFYRDKPGSYHEVVVDGRVVS